MRALVLDAEKCTAFVSDVNRPKPAPGEILIRVQAVALNPVDSLYIYNPLGGTGRIVGSDFAGTVLETGVDVPSSKIATNDRVAGFVQGASSANDRPGAFTEYVAIPWDLAWKVASEMTLEQAATISLCGLTAAQALFYRLGLPSPFPWAHQVAERPSTARSGPTRILIYGASTSVGLYAAQLVHKLRQSTEVDISLIGAASAKHFEMLKGSPYSYDQLFDYRDNDWADQVRSLCRNQGLEFAYDCISEGDTVSKISNLMRPDGKLAVVRSREGGAWVADEHMSIEPSYGAVWGGLGEDVEYKGMHLPSNPNARAFAVAFYQWLSTTAGLQPNRVRLMPGGLERIVPDAFQLLGSGSMHDRNMVRTEAYMRPVSAEKLVYKITEELDT